MGKLAGRIIMGGMMNNLGDLIQALKVIRAANEAIDATADKDDDAKRRTADLWRGVVESTRGYQNGRGVQDLRALCGERYGTELVLESVRMLRGEYCALTGVSVNEADNTSVPDIVAMLRAKRTKKPTPAPPCVYLQRGQLQIGDGEPFTISDSDAAELEILIENRSGTDSQLKAAGIGNPSRRFSEIRQRYDGKLAPYIFCPVRKNSGGYRTTIIMAR